MSAAVDRNAPFGNCSIWVRKASQLLKRHPFHARRSSRSGFPLKPKAPQISDRFGWTKLIEQRLFCTASTFMVKANAKLRTTMTVAPPNRRRMRRVTVAPTVLCAQSCAGSFSLPRSFERAGLSRDPCQLDRSTTGCDQRSGGERGCLHPDRNQAALAGGLGQPSQPRKGAGGIGAGPDRKTGARDVSHKIAAKIGCKTRSPQRYDQPLTLALIHAPQDNGNSRGHLSLL